MPSHVFLDIDIDGARAAHERACAFVASSHLKYGLSSRLLSELGGSERARLPELYASDHSWSSQGRLLLEPPAHERLVFELLTEAAPLCCENFSALCTGEKGKAKGSGLPLHFKGSPMHRLVKGQFVQGGDFTHGNGAGGECIWGSKFKDEKGALAVKVDSRGLLCMSNTGKNSNGSQFFISLAPLPKLSGKHCVFGRMVEGEEVLKLLEALPCEAEKPAQAVVIAACGKL